MQEPTSFLDALWNEKVSNLEAMVEACNDIKFCLETASLEEEEEDGNFENYSKTTMDLLRAEKADTVTRILHVKELAEGFQFEIEKMKAGDKEEEEVQDATQNQEEVVEEKEVSNISKTQNSAVDSQTGAEKFCAPSSK